MHMYNEAIAELRRAVELSGDNTAFDSQLAYAYAISGQTEDAIKIVKGLEVRPDRSSSTDPHIVLIYAGLGDHGRAMRWLNKAYQARFNPSIPHAVGFRSSAVRPSVSGSPASYRPASRSCAHSIDRPVVTQSREDRTHRLGVPTCSRVYSRTNGETFITASGQHRGWTVMSASFMGLSLGQRISTAPNRRGCAQPPSA
jgi:tetratricopeptide (TPR) repeat protein